MAELQRGLGPHPHGRGHKAWGPPTFPNWNTRDWRCDTSSNGPSDLTSFDPMSLKREHGKVILLFRLCILHKYHFEENLHNLNNLYGAHYRENVIEPRRAVGSP